MFICIHSEYISRNASSQSTITFHSTHQHNQMPPHEVVDVTRQNGGPHSLCLFVKHENHPKWRGEQHRSQDRRSDADDGTRRLDDDWGDICTTGHWLRMSKDAPMLVANGAKISLHRSSKSPLSCKEPSSTRRQRNARTRRMLGVWQDCHDTVFSYGPDRP
jgi:ribosomal protein L31